VIPSTVIRVVRPHVGVLAALAVVAALVAGARAGSSPERYQADALLRLEQLAANDLLGAATPNRIDPDRYLANELEVLTSGPVIDAAIAAGADEAVLDALSVSGVGETDIVQIAAVADQPEVAVAAVDAVVAAYQALTTEAARVDVERQVAELDAQLLVLSERLASSDQRLADPALPAAEAAVLETQRETDASTYAQLAADRQRTQARVGLAAPGGEVVEGPGEAEAVPGPAPISAAAGGAVAAGLAGVGVLVARDRFQNRIIDRRQIEDLDLGLRVFGEIPAGVDLDDGSGIPLQARRPDGPVATAFRLLRRSVQVTWELKPGAVVLVASPARREGRTTVVANLATACARTGVDALVVDGDLRRAGLSAALDVPAGQAGLTSVLEGSYEPWEATVETLVHGLRALPAGPVLGDPVELLGTERAVTVCRDAADDEVILVDSPPLLESPDAQLLLASADAVLLVVRAGQTTVRELEAAVQAIGEVTTAPLGVVLNAASTK
jgi:capsular exopolysaccharide synthesis family protein